METYSLPINAIHTSEDGIETKGKIVKILPNDLPLINRTYCLFEPEEGESFMVFLDELQLDKPNRVE